MTMKVDPKEYQPIALIPIQDAPGHEESASNLYLLIRDSLTQKRYILINEAEVSRVLEETKMTALNLLSDRDSLMKMGDRLKARLLFIGALPEYRVQKSHLAPQTLQIWDGETFQERTLPTYYRGTSQIRLILRMYEVEKGEVVWRAEGTIRGPSHESEAYGRKLIESLLKDLPAVAVPPKK
jgi:hypothetical protein